MKVHPFHLGAAVQGPVLVRGTEVSCSWEAASPEAQATFTSHPTPAAAASAAFLGLQTLAAYLKRCFAALSSLPSLLSPTTCPSMQEPKTRTSADQSEFKTAQLLQTVLLSHLQGEGE